MIPCKGNHWLLSQTFPEMIGGVTSTLHVTSTMSFRPRKEILSSVRLNTAPEGVEIFVMVQIIPNIVFIQWRCPEQKLESERLIVSDSLFYTFILVSLLNCCRSALYLWAVIGAGPWYAGKALFSLNSLILNFPNNATDNTLKCNNGTTYTTSLNLPDTCFTTTLNFLLTFTLQINLSPTCSLLITPLDQ